MPLPIRRCKRWNLNKRSKIYYLLGGFFFLMMLVALDRGLLFTLRAWESNSALNKDLQNLFFQKRDFNKKFLDLPKGTYSTLILGSSRTHRGIHPFYIHKRLKQNAFKIAKAKIRLKFNYYFYNEYKKIAGVPKVVIYGLDYFMFKLESHPFFMKQVLPNDVQAESGYNNGPLLLLSNKKKTDDFINDKLEQWNKDLAAADGGEKFRIIDPFIGYRKFKNKEMRDRRRFKTFDYFGYPGVEGIYFKKLLEEWQKDGVQVVLVHLPDYIGTLKSNHQLDRFLREIRELTASYKNVSIYDYNDPKKFSLSNKAYFLDGGYGKTNSHLSIAGSRVFHRIFLRDLKKHYNN